MTSSGVRPDDEPLEVARRLEDLEVGLLDDAVLDPQPEGSLALDPGQPGDVDGEVAGRLRGQGVGVMHRRLDLSCQAPRRAARADRRGRR